MAVRSGFWNSSGSDIRRYYNSDFSHLISLLINDGVSQNYGDSLIPTTGNGMTVVIQTGEAWFNDIWLRNDTDLVIDIDAAPIVSGYSRLDAIAIKIDARSSVRDATIVYMAGTPTAGTPTLPEMVDTADVHWHMLASVLVKTNDTSIPRERITNYVGSNNTPLITGLIETISAEALIQQWQAEFNSWNSNKQAEFEDWVETIQGILDEEAAGHLQLEIEDLYSKTHTNLLNPTLKTTTSNGVTCTNNGDGTYTVTGAVESGNIANFIIEDNFKLPLNTPLKLVGCPAGGGTGPTNIIYKLALFDHAAQHQVRYDYGSGSSAYTNDGTYNTFRMHLAVYAGAGTVNLTFKPMITTDVSATYDDFVQYGGDGELNKQVASLHEKSKGVITNLIDPTLDTKTLGGIMFTSNGDGTFTLNGTATAAVVQAVQIEIPLENNKKYKLTGQTASGAVSVDYSVVSTSRSTGTRAIVATDRGNGATFTTNTDDFKYELRFNISKNAVVENKVFKPMITTDLEATYDDFVPYSGNGRLNKNVAEIHDLLGDPSDLIFQNHTVTKNIKRLQEQIARFESTNTATNSYAVGDYLVLNSQLRKVTAPIAVGDAITPANTGFTRVDAELKSFNSSLANLNERIAHDIQWDSSKHVVEMGYDWQYYGNFIVSYANAICIVHVYGNPTSSTSATVTNLTGNAASFFSVGFFVKNGKTIITFSKSGSHTGNLTVLPLGRFTSFYIIQY